MAAVTLVPPDRRPERTATRATSPTDDGVDRSKPRRARTWMWALGVAIALLLGAIPVIGAWRGEARWRSFRAAAALAQADFDAREPTRPVLWGEASAERAWPHYEQAFTQLSTATDAGYLAYLGRLEGRRLGGGGKAEPPRDGPPTADVVAAYATALDGLRAGAHATDGRRPMVWSAGFSHPIQNLLIARELANAAVLTAIVAAAGGDGEGAARLLLDTMQFGRDLAQSPLMVEQMIGCAVVVIGAGNAIEWSNLLRHLDPGALRTLAQGLATLDGALPLDSGWLATDAVLLAHTDLDALSKDANLLGGRSWQTWRQGFSTRLAIAEHGLSQLDLAACVHTLCAGRASLDLAALDRLFAEAATSNNPATQILTPNLSAAPTTRLSAVASLRMLRMAVQHAAGEAVTALPDPSGGTLQWTLDADGNAEFWSDAHRKLPRLRVPK